MCEKLYFVWFLLFWLCSSAVAAQGEEQFYLISETELQSIEKSLAGLETDRQSWELQARGLKNEAGSLNSQLSEERRQYRTLEQSFNKYEADQLALVSLKNGEIADLKQEIATERLEKEKYRGKATTRLLIIIGLAASWIIFIAYKIYRIFKPF
jgi:chromosome segregation ATPase